jgi:pyruvate/2-oxoglutarate dehydrogenase complex dihydrolipoamide acyltransferase (E2) component
MATMKLKHKDKTVFEKEGVIERSSIDAREILATGNYELVSNDASEKSDNDDPDGNEVKTSEAVAKFAADNDVDLAKVVGSGRNGNILKKDVEEFIKDRTK